MAHSKLAVALAILAVPMAVTVASDAARAQARDCVIVGNINPIGINSAGTIEMNAGETCNMFLTTSGTIESARISEPPKHGTLTMGGAGNASYRPREGFTGTDEFAMTITGRGPTSSGTSVLTVRANVK
jgi:hypothetical protein